MVRHQNKNYKKEKINNNQIEGMSTIESIITIGLGILLLFIGGGLAYMRRLILISMILVMQIQLRVITLMTIRMLKFATIVALGEHLSVAN